MQRLPHIDIVDEDRIESILADPANFAWRAVDCETLDTWSPDFGLTSYARPSIFRPAGVAAGGFPSTLRHRFWGTVEGQSDHSGSRYVGIVLYAAHGEETPMELHLGGAEIGRVEPDRYDNRRHLIVVDRPILFEGEMEVFRLTAPGRGVYRIEHFVLLREKPDPSLFVPHIRGLSIRTTAEPTGRWSATLHFTTARTAICTVEGGAEGQPALAHRTAGYRRLHSLEITDLAPDCRYTFTLTARERGGAADVRSIGCVTAHNHAQSDERIGVPVELFNMASIALDCMPLTFGVPLPRGILVDGAGCTLGTEEQSAVAQYRIHSRWPDCSARWALVDTALPHFPAEGPLSATVEFGPAHMADGGGLTCRSSTDGVVVENKHLRVALRPQDPVNWLHIERVDGASDGRPILPTASGRGPGFDVMIGAAFQLEPSPVRELQVEEAGEHRVALCFAIDHADGEGVAHLRSNVRLHIFADQTFIKVVHRLEVISPALAPAAGGALLTPGAEAPQDIVAGSRGEEAALLKLRRFTFLLPLDGVQAVVTADDRWPITGRSWRLTHDDDRYHRIGIEGQTERHDSRHAGQLRVDTASGSIGIALRRFWQSYPKGFEVVEDGVRLELLPELLDEPSPADEDAWHRLGFWRRDGLYLLKAGMALTNEILLDFSAEGEELDRAFAWFEHRTPARPNLERLRHSDVLFPIAGKAGSILPAYETLVDQAIDSFESDREHHRAYGQINYGDWYGESGWSWGNNEYDPAFCAYLEFLRGGSPRWAVWGAESTRHLVDVDTVNHSDDPEQVGGQAMHMPGHVGGYLPPFFRSKMGGTNSIPSHTWVEGPALHYLLSGDETVRESMDRTGQWLLRGAWFDNYEFSNCREAGWHLIHLSMLARLDVNPRILNAISIIVERVLERQEPGGGWVRMLQEAHCGCGYPRCRGEAGFMVGILLSGLQRVHQINGDERVAQAIVGGARWLIDNTYDEESGHFRYTSCPNRTLGGGFQQTQWVLEGLAGAHALSGDEEIGRYLQRGLDTIGRFPEGLDHLGLGKAMAQQMRFVPTLLWALQQRSLPEVCDD